MITAKDVRAALRRSKRIYVTGCVALKTNQQYPIANGCKVVAARQKTNKQVIVNGHPITWCEVLSECNTWWRCTASSEIIRALTAVVMNPNG